MKKIAPVYLLAILGVLAGSASEPARSAGAIPGNVHSLDWLAGRWCMPTASGMVEEYWLPESGGLLLGIGRTVKNGKATGFEFLRIETFGATLRYIAQPGGAPPTIFQGDRKGENQFEVLNPEHDFPQKIFYRRDGDVLQATISGPGTDGQEQSIHFDYDKCPDDQAED